MRPFRELPRTEPRRVRVSMLKVQVSRPDQPPYPADPHRTLANMVEIGEGDRGNLPNIAPWRGAKYSVKDLEKSNNYDIRL